MAVFLEHFKLLKTLTATNTAHRKSHRGDSTVPERVLTVNRSRKLQINPSLSPLSRSGLLFARSNSQLPKSSHNGTKLPPFRSQ
ncbi:hypothetical protein COLO4_16298 [Corchorus olitorius]|uniref:Uncharacterized protein n=1 Tax=Corchorus olitorius TaxID=93759 RepID=A0A1R3JID0_9ROSI|nr:hypothetical protein COLO4_16298 [Corchorus olitorius]